jgi:hypothetical protein
MHRARHPRAVPVCELGPTATCREFRAIVAEFRQRSFKLPHDASWIADPVFALKGGCGGGGIYRIKAASSSGIAFRLQTASAEACKPLEELANR